MGQPAIFSSDAIGESTQILTVDGACEPSTALEAEHQIVNLLDNGRTKIVFDLRGVNSLDPSMLHVLFRGFVQIKGRSGTFVIVRPNPSVWALFETSGLDKTLASSLDLKAAMVRVSGELAPS